MKYPSEINVLVACEESQAVTIAFRKRGFNAFSCDLLPCSGGHPEWHYQCDVFEIIDKGWDLMIAHPPCTWLCQAMRTNAARKDRPNISNCFFEERQMAYQFFMDLYNANIKHIAVENPIGYVNSAFRKPNQIIRPFMFGHPYKKDVCLWLKDLPKLIPTNIVEGRKKLDFWSTKRNPNGVSLKSKTFSGIAEAMAEQWGNYLITTL
jgi:hypothetical protein